MPIPAPDDFDTIFCSTDDEAVKSRLAISPTKIRSGSILKASCCAGRMEVGSREEELGRRMEDQVDYELESGEEEGEEDASQMVAMNYLTTAGYGTFMPEKPEKYDGAVDSTPVCNITRRPSNEL